MFGGCCSFRLTAQGHPAAQPVPKDGLEVALPPHESGFIFLQVQLPSRLSICVKCHFTASALTFRGLGGSPSAPAKKVTVAYHAGRVLSLPLQPCPQDRADGSGLGSRAQKQDAKRLVP